ncbi:hypothetical protein [Rhodoluna limnophila]|uniref:hypothetical protein n=1 Tax=Rhodoluna limnophila TaxID=232537 RepID=UPI0011071FC9|nr:hypothetical protein [Rhodoluna limnophila]
MNQTVRQIKVTFLTFYFEAWDALAETHRIMSGDPRFDVTVVAIDRKLTGDEGYGGVADVAAFFDSHGIKHLVNADLAALEPDYIFVNYPWQRNYPPQYRPDKLAAIGRIVYVPYYSLPLVAEPVDGVHPESGFEAIGAHLYTQRMHQLASLVVVQDKFLKGAYGKLPRGNDHVHFVGSTKLDALIEEVEEIAESGQLAVRALTTLVWAPHHSYSPHWLNFGVFAQVCWGMLDWAAANPAVRVILRPHPFLFGTLVDREVMTREALDDWLARWRDLPNTSIDSESSSAMIFAQADALLTDGISYLAEWPLAMGKPALFMENPEHWMFSDLGELAAAAAVKVDSLDQLAEYLVAVPSRTTQIEALRAAAMPYPGEAAERIVTAVAADRSGLIDPATVTEVPWELQAGREPLKD